MLSSVFKEGKNQQYDIIKTKLIKIDYQFPRIQT